MNTHRNRTGTAASPSTWGLTGEKREEQIVAQRAAWTRLRVSMAKGNRCVKSLASIVLMEKGIDPDTANSDEWLAAAQIAYNRNAYATASYYGTDKDW